MEQNTSNAALLVMDMQTMMLGMLPGGADEFVSKVAQAIAAARENKIPVIYVRIGFRPGAPEINMKNKGFAAGGRERWANIDMNEWLEIHPGVAPQPDEIVTTKRRVSAFTGSDLEVVLRAFGIEHLILTGYATGGVVLSTVREAADKDYRLTVLADGCADSDEETHRILTTKIFLRQAEVLTVSEWVSSEQ